MVILFIMILVERVLPPEALRILHSTLSYIHYFILFIFPEKNHVSQMSIFGPLNHSNFEKYLLLILTLMTPVPSPIHLAEMSETLVSRLRLASFYEFLWIAYNFISYFIWGYKYESNSFDVFGFRNKFYGSSCRNQTRTHNVV